MYFLNNNPFVRVLFPFIFGIVLYDLAGSISGLPVLLFCFIAIFFSLFFFYKKFLFKHRWIDGLAFFMLFFLFGNYYSFKNDVNKHTQLSEFSGGKAKNFIIRINNQVEERKNSIKSTAKILFVINNEGDVLRVNNEKIVLYFSKGIAKNYKYGDKLIIHSFINEVDSPKNPKTFNYKKFLSRKGILYSGYVSEGNSRLLSRNEGNALLSYAIGLREKIQNNLKKFLGDTDEYNVATAILTGYRGNLDFDLRQSFVNSGAMHVMCVSGLHVGIIFLILKWFFSFLSDKKFKLRLLKVILILSIIWFYALMTGFSSSVLRASAMFSFLALGMIWNKKINVFNSLAASALLLLLINPFSIFDIGFQLSYLAVIGIVILFNPIQQIIPASNKVTKYLRDLAAVSIAAQVATTPVSLYYFGQFPNYFILTNIIVIPLTGFIIYTAIPALLLSGVNFAGEFLYSILALLLKIMTTSVKFVDSIPFSVTETIYVSLLQMFILYVLIFSIYKMYISKYKYLLFVSLCCLIVFFSVRSYRVVNNWNTSEIIIPYLRNQSAVAIISERECYVILEDTSKQTISSYKMMLDNYNKSKNIKNIYYHSINDEIKTSYFSFSYPYVIYGEDRYIFWKPEWQKSIAGKKQKVTGILFHNNPFVKFDKVDEIFNSDLFVFTTSNKIQTVRIWENLLKNHNKKYYNIYNEGAWVKKYVVF